MKYVLSNEMRKIKPRQGKEVVLYRIKAIQNFTVMSLKSKVRYEGEKRTIVRVIEEKRIKAGDSGGFVQSEKNLSQEGSCWIDNDAFAFGAAKVCDDAYLGGRAAIGGKVKLFDETKVVDEVQLGGSMKLYGHSVIIGKGSYYDNGVYKNLCVGYVEEQESTEETTEQAKESNSSREVKVEVEIDGKKIVTISNFD